MSRKERIESATGYYHVMQRGNGKQILFEDENDYKRYLGKLEECKACLDFELIAYCLMGNHVHLLVHADNLSVLSKLMNRLGISYAKWYNLKYEHVGYVFQGRYSSEPIQDESYLLACVRYIHNNPVKAGVGKREAYRWSSFNEYFNSRKLIDSELIENMFASKAQYELFSASEDDKVFMDVDADMVSFSVGQEIIGRFYGNEFVNTLMVKQLCVEERNSIILKMKLAGLNNRQIELLTGVSRNIINRLH